MKRVLSLFVFMTFSVSVYSSDFENIKLSTDDIKMIVEDNTVVELPEEKAETSDACWAFADRVECFCTGGSQGYDSFPIWQAAYEYCQAQNLYN